MTDKKREKPAKKKATSREKRKPANTKDGHKIGMLRSRCDSVSNDQQSAKQKHLRKGARRIGAPGGTTNKYSGLQTHPNRMKVFIQGRKFPVSILRLFATE